jgi:vancomycin permeability regulator SanA
MPHCMNDATHRGRTVIVIFGAAVRPDGSPSTALWRRVQAAYAFGHRQDNAIYVPTGAIGRHGPSEASVMARLLRDQGVPDENILLEESGTSTLTSTRAVLRLLQAHGRHLGPVYAATSAYHLVRCVVLMRLAGLDARACPAWRRPAARNFRKRWYWRLREVVALPVDVAIMGALRLFGRV